MSAVLQRIATIESMLAPGVNGSTTLTGTNINMVLPIYGDPTVTPTTTSVLGLMDQIQQLNQSVIELQAFRTAALSAVCLNGLVMIGVQNDGTPLCSSTPVQERLGTVACPVGQVLRNASDPTSGCAVDSRFSGNCPQNQSLTGVSSSGQAMCGQVVTPSILQESNEAVVMEAERLVNNTNPNITAAFLACATQGLSYSTSERRCMPAFIHEGCPDSIPNIPSNCSAVEFDDQCPGYCPAGTTTAPTVRTTNYTCGALGLWSRTGPTLTCRMPACPRFSTSIRNRTLLGFPANVPPPPHCECVAGYAGNTTWNAAHGNFSSQCVLEPCPGNNGQGPSNCGCPSGYTGRPTWDAANQRWSISSCNQVACPAGGTGAPNCRCGSGYTGTLRFSNGRYTGTCTRVISQNRCISSGGENRWARPRCPSGLRIRRVTWACYGRYARCGGQNCGCGRTLTSTINGRCRGRTGCDQLASNGWWGDPCGGHNKPLVINYECSNVYP